MSIIDGIIRFDQEFDEVFHLRLIGLHQVAEILEIFHFPCLGPELDLTVAAVVQGNIQDFAMLKNAASCQLRSYAGPAVRRSR